MLKDPKKIVKEITAQVGKREAERLLKEAGVKPSTAEKLAGGRYVSEVGYQLALKIHKAHTAAYGKLTA